MHIDPSQARQLILSHQRLHQPQTDALAVLNALGYIQIDTLSVVQRAHHHTFWARLPAYNPEHLEQLLQQKQAFEYWSHAAAYLPMRDYRYSLPRKQAIQSGEQKHWYERDEKLMQYVLQRIRTEGPLQSKDFEASQTKLGIWQRKPAKKALEQLFHDGRLMVPYRRHFQKVYDLTERVLPEGIDVSMPSRQAYLRHLIIRFLAANALGEAKDIAYLRKNTKTELQAVIKTMLHDGELINVQVGNKQYFALPSSLDNLNQMPQPTLFPTLILSPFDNLLIQRQRMRDLFNFDYQLECYVPAAKRRHGYFALPILWQGELVARMDCKAARKTGQFHLHNFVLEDTLKGDKLEAFRHDFSSALQDFMHFNNCQQLDIPQKQWQWMQNR